MPPLSLPALQSGKPTAWEEAIYAFLVEKRSRSGSTRTVESYARMLWPFFRVTTPDQVRSADVLAYAHGIGASGRVPSSTTVGARIACLSSFYRFTIRMGLLTGNPCDALERPRTVPSVARGTQRRRGPPHPRRRPDTVRGRRDRAILLVLVLTGRRRAEVIGLRAGDLSLEGETVFYSYRGQGRQARPPRAPPPCPRGDPANARRCRQGPRDDGPGRVALAGGSRSRRDQQRHVLRAVPPLPPGGRADPDRAPRSAPHGGEAPSRCRGVDRGGQSFLDHSSLAVTTVYLRRLEGETDRTWPDVAVAIGV
jgi:integrase